MTLARTARRLRPAAAVPHGPPAEPAPAVPGSLRARPGRLRPARVRVPPRPAPWPPTRPWLPSARSSPAASPDQRIRAAPTTVGAAFVLPAGPVVTQARLPPNNRAGPAARSRRGSPTLVPVAGHGDRVLRAGLTGGIGSGKSEVSRRLAAHGAVIIDADIAARAVVELGTPGLARVAEAFGADVLGPDGALDRDRLGGIVFRDPASRATLNAIVHPLVAEWMRAAEQAAVDAARGDLIIVHEVPLLAENRRADGFDLV